MVSSNLTLFGVGPQTHRILDAKGWVDDGPIIYPHEYMILRVNQMAQTSSCTISSCCKYLHSFSKAVAFILEQECWHSNPEYPRCDNRKTYFRPEFNVETKEHCLWVLCVATYICSSGHRLAEQIITRANGLAISRK
jgi:hypothetical protein